MIVKDKRFSRNWLMIKAHFIHKRKNYEPITKGKGYFLVPILLLYEFYWKEDWNSEFNGASGFHCDIDSKIGFKILNYQ